MNYTRGDIYYIEAFPTVGHEQRPGRPAVIVSNNMNNRQSSVLEIVYLTTAYKGNLPTHVTIRSAPKVSTVLCEQVHTIDARRAKNFCGRCTNQEMQAIDTAIMISLGLNIAGVPAKPTAATSAPSGDAAELIAVRAQRDLLRMMYDELLQHKT